METSLEFQLDPWGRWGGEEVGPRKSWEERAAEPKPERAPGSLDPCVLGPKRRDAVFVLCLMAPSPGLTWSGWTWEGWSE